jgi:four helix bundle protein
MELGMAEIQERTLQFACRIVRLHDFLIRRHGAAKTIARQLLRSGTSIGSNMAEATAGQSKADFISKCSIATKEARETHYWLRLLAASSSVPTEQIEPLVNEANQLVSILTTIVKNASAPG